MALTDTFVKSIKPSGAAAGDKHSDGQGLYLHVKVAGRYWRLNYRFLDKQKTLALGVYPAVGLADARRARDAARKQLAQGVDPSTAKREAKQAKTTAAANTFEVVARAWLAKTAPKLADSTHEKTTTWLEKDVFPHIGNMPITAIGPRDVLRALRVIEARGAVDSAHRIKQICGQVFRFAVAEGSAERDITADLRGALEHAEKKHYAAITEPPQVGELMRSIFDYTGNAYTEEALKLTPLVFVRLGELHAAEWSEFNLDTAEWCIPGNKMKMKAGHLVPLSTQAVVLLRRVQAMTWHALAIIRIGKDIHETRKPQTPRRIRTWRGEWPPLYGQAVSFCRGAVVHRSCPHRGPAALERQ